MSDDEGAAANNLACAIRYYHDAPDECWKNPEVLELLRNGGWGKASNNGGLMGCTFNGYTFAYKGLPMWGWDDFQ